MTKSLIPFFLFILINCKDNQPINCSNFYEGEFTYLEKEFSNVRIIRSLKTQTESVGDSIKSIFSINWIGDCDYTLVPIATYYKSTRIFVPNDTIFVKIIEIVSDSSYRVKSNFLGREIESTIIKVGSRVP